MKTKGQLLYEAYCHKRVEGDDAPEWDKLWDKRKRIWEGMAELFEQEQALREKA